MGMLTIQPKPVPPLSYDERHPFSLVHDVAEFSKPEMSLPDAPVDNPHLKNFSLILMDQNWSEPSRANPIGSPPTL